MTLKNYIENLIPRLKKFSASLDKKEIFIDKPWIFVDEDDNLQKFIFRRNGELLMSLNGKVTSGKWEYIPIAKSLLIDRVSDKILLNQSFIDPAVMILKMDGSNGNNFILANEELIPSLNVDEYLKKLYYEKNRIVTVQLKHGIELEVLDYDGGVFDKKRVMIEGKLVPDSIFEHATYEKKYVIQNSRITRILVTVNYNTKKGLITIEQELHNSASVGDSVFLNNFPAPNGKYKLGFMHYIKVKNGLVNSTNIF